MLFVEVLSGQSTLEISGNALFLDGEPAVEAGVILTFENSIELGDFTSTDASGSYSFSIDLPVDFDDECFEVSLLNCDGFFLPFSGCYSPINTEFEFDFTFCEYGNSFCSTFITSTPFDGDNIELSILQFGIGPFTYLWDDGFTEANRTLPISTEGNYCVTVTANDGCVSDACIILDPVDPCFVFIVESNGYENTTLIANGFGASEQLDYQWSTGANSESIQIGVGGEYCVTISDVMGCVAEDCLSVTVDSSAWLDCYAEIEVIEGKDDQLIVSAFGVEPFDYLWTIDGLTVGDGEFITVSESGNYCVEVKDAEDCIYEVCYEYVFISDCSVVFTWSQPGGNPQLNAISSGVGPYLYNWNVGSDSSSISIEKSGFYCVSIEDSTGCETSFCEFVDINLFNVCDVDIVSATLGSNEIQLSLTHLGQVETSDYTYTWSNGEVGDKITITEGGFYCVSVQDNQGCEFETCEYIAIDSGSLDDGLIVSYINTDSKAGEDAVLELYEISNNGVILIDHLEPWNELEETGLYYSEFINDGNYFVRAVPSAFETFIPSYNKDTPYWDESEVIEIVENGEGLNSIVNVIAIPIINLSGPGAIGGGTFNYGDPYNVMLFKDETPVRQKTTDGDGDFLFDDLPYGTYTLVRETPGMNRVEVEVTISEFNPEELNVFLDTQITSIDDFFDVQIGIYPNPCNDIITVKSELLRSVTSQIIFQDMNGIKVEVFVKNDIEMNQSVINVSNLDSGVYFLTIKNENRIQTQKLIKI